MAADRTESTPTPPAGIPSATNPHPDLYQPDTEELSYSAYKSLVSQARHNQPLPEFSTRELDMLAGRSPSMTQTHLYDFWYALHRKLFATKTSALLTVLGISAGVLLAYNQIRIQQIKTLGSYQTTLSAIQCDPVLQLKLGEPIVDSWWVASERLINTVDLRFKVSGPLGYANVLSRSRFQQGGSHIELIEVIPMNGANAGKEKIYVTNTAAIESR
eukprot:TRINITY_DN3589_c0_g1_i2.p1 TRINITY_DN3589_c0_g1~~TRINITY_DN3589_c0_g1_i2.p1  ORF type:complete len:216 (+),score=66.84 TRINITY_DN3589_c0_g1_i2:103-750(+)